MRATITASLIAAGTLVYLAVPAWAHNEFEPASAAPGSVASLTLSVEDESSSADTSKLQLVFPSPITVAELPAVAGWTATVDGGRLGSPATGVTWQGTPRPGDLKLPIKLGPLPADAGRLQFKALQTYDNGDVERWIDDWPKGAPEPEHPGPVLDLVPGAAGVIPATTTTQAPGTTATTIAPTTTAAGDESAADESNDSGTSPLVWLIPAAIVVIAVGGGYAYLRSRRSSDTPS
jgi:periplasmic copper chaperone A